MIAPFLQGLWQGLAGGVGCVGCWGVFLTIILSRAGTLKHNLGLFVQFSLGRFLAYVAVGAAVGYLGTALGELDWVRVATASAYILLSVLLLLWGMRPEDRKKCDGFAIRPTLPFAAGLIMGLNICPPFLIAVTSVLQGGSVAFGLWLFAGFFVGVTIFMFPVTFAGLGVGVEFLRSLGRVACISAALFFLYTGLSQLPAVNTRVLSFILPRFKVTQEVLQKFLPEAAKFSEKMGGKGAPAYYKAFDAQGEPCAIVFNTDEVVSGIRGYNGSVPVLVVCDMTGRIIKVKILPNRETPDYLARMNTERFLGQFSGKKISDAISLGTDIDGVTGATVTCRAVTDSVSQSLRRISASYLGAEVVAAPAKGLPLGMRDYAVIIFFVAASVIFLAENRLARYVLLLTVTLYFGFYLGAFLFSSCDIARILFFRFGVFSGDISWYLLLIGILVSTLLFGRLFCGYICPFGAVTEIIWRAFRFRQKPKASPALQCGGGEAADFSPRDSRKPRADSREMVVDIRLRRAKYLLLFLVPALFFVRGRVGDCAIEPFATLFGLGGSALEILFLVFVLVASVFVFRFFCRYFCPAGALMAIFSPLQIIKKRLAAPENCADCRECIRVCAIGALSFSESREPGAEGRGRKGKILLASSECIGCGDCLRSCKKRLVTPTQSSQVL
jgi:polyferredoxin/Na+-translocating ferredoxin:NAD+ oxidoreductase RnfG subunit